MAWDWSTINRGVDEVAIVGGIALLVVRQFRWRSAKPRHMLRLPLLIIVVGSGYLGVELTRGIRWTPADWLILVELVLVALTGTVMGRVTRFRLTDHRPQYKLTGAGIWLWVVFVAIRVGFYALAHALGSKMAGSNGPLLIAFGANRLFSVVVVRARTRALLHEEASATESVGMDLARHNGDGAGPRSTRRSSPGSSSQ